MNNNFKRLFLCLILFNSFCWAQSIVNLHIAKFKDDKACAISYTFDDGLKEHYTLVTPFLNKLGLKATFVINGSKINPDEKSIADTTRMTWKDLKEMAKTGQEISNHGWAHKNFGKFTLTEIKEDIVKNDSAILKNIGIRPLTFAYPNNTKTAEGMKIAAENRVDTRTFQRSLGGKSTTEDLDSWVLKLQNDHDWGITMTHGITYGYDHFTHPNILWEHLKKVKTMEDKIWVGTFLEVASYVKERDSTSFQIKQLGDGHYVVTPTCTLDNSIFTAILTAVLEEKNIVKAEIRQGKNKLRAQIVSDKLLFSFDPFGGAIDIKIQRKK